MIEAITETNQIQAISEAEILVIEHGSETIEVFEESGVLEVLDDDGGTIEVLSESEVIEILEGGPFTGGGISTPTVYTTRTDETALYIYCGEALPGSDEADPVWKIKRMTRADLDVLWADGNSELDNVWDDHLILSYS